MIEFTITLLLYLRSSAFISRDQFHGLMRGNWDFFDWINTRTDILVYSVVVFKDRGRRYSFSTLEVKVGIGGG